MFTYEQSTGKMFANDGSLLGTCYSGNGPCLNDPESDAIQGHGPLPRGTYMISVAINSPYLGPIAMRLLPNVNNVMHGRGGFWIHGDNDAMNLTASDGCIVAAKNIRTTINASSDRVLKVVDFVTVDSDVQA